MPYTIYEKAGSDAAVAAALAALPPEGTRGLIITDTSVVTIPAGTTADNLAAYYNSGASAITVAGVALAAGSHAVWAWVSGAWVLLASGAGTTPPALGAPTVAVESVTDTTITVSYSTTATGVTAWQYRLDGGEAAALDGASPDVIGGFLPRQTGAVEARFTVDGTSWSPWGIAAYTTSSDLVFAQLRSYPYDSVTTITGTLETGIAASSTGVTLLTTSSQARVGATGYGAQAKITAGPATTTFRLSQPSAGSGGTNIAAKAMTVTGGKYYVTDPAFPSAVVAEIGDVLWAKYTGSAVEYSVSKDDGATWLVIGSSAVATTPTMPVAPVLGINGSVAWLKTHGMSARWGDVDGVENSQSLTLPASTGITTLGGGVYTLTNATGRGYAVCDVAPKHLSVTITGLQTGIAGPRLWTSNSLTPGAAPAGDRNILTIGADHVLTIEQGTASEGLTPGPTNTGITLVDGDRITMIQRGSTSYLVLDSRAQIRVLGTWPWWKTLTIDTPGGVGVGTVAVKLGVSA